MYTPISVNYHALHDDGFVVRVQERPPVSSGGPYYELHIGEITIFLADYQCKQILDCLGSRPPLPQPEQECTCVRTGDIDDASNCEAHR